MERDTSKGCGVRLVDVDALDGASERTNLVGEGDGASDCVVKHENPGSAGSGFSRSVN